MNRSSTWRSSAMMVSIGFAFSGMLTGGLMQADVTVYERVFGLNHERVAFWLSVYSVLTAIGGGVAGLLSDRWGAGRIYKGCIILSGAGLILFSLAAEVLIRDAGPADVGDIGTWGVGDADPADVGDIGTWGVGDADPAATLFGLLVSALGIGGLVVGNILVSGKESGAPARSLNFLHASHGMARLAGVVLSIFVIGVLWRMSYLILGIAFLIHAAAFVSPPPPATRLSAADSGGRGADPAGGRPALSLFAVSLGFLLYMTAEMVLVTWLAAYFEQDQNWGARYAKATYVIFLAGLIFGRLYSARRWPLEMTPSGCAALAAIHAPAIFVFLVTQHFLPIAISLFVAGFCEGPGWPALFSYAMRRSRGSEGRVTGIVYVVCCVAIVLSTAGSGVLAQRMGFRSVFYVVGAAHVLFSLILYRLLRNPLPDQSGLPPYRFSNS